MNNNNTLQQIQDKLNELALNPPHEYEELISHILLLLQQLESPWISVKDRMPDHLETVWLTNGRQITLGCLIDFPNEEGWHWAGSNGIIYIQDGKIVAECESDDLDVTHWMPLPEPPKE